MRTLLILTVLSAGCLDYGALGAGVSNVNGEDGGDGGSPDEDMATPDTDASMGDMLAPPTCGVTVARGAPAAADNACCAFVPGEDGGAPVGTCNDPSAAFCLVLTNPPFTPFCQFCGQLNGDPCCPPAGDDISVDGAGLNTCTAGLRCMSGNVTPRCLAATGCGGAGQACCPLSSSGGGDIYCELGLRCTGSTCQPPPACGSAPCPGETRCLENNLGALRCGTPPACGGAGEPCCWIDATFGWACDIGATTCQSDTSSPNGTRCKT